MRYGIFGDVHGNLEGLEAVLAALAQERVDTLVCIGDVVGYGANPNECCERVRGLDALCLFGNHDQAALGQVDIRWFNSFARQAAEWTREQLQDEHKAWLRGLSPQQELDDFLAVHSSLPDPWAWTYVTTPALAAETMNATRQRLVFVGHSHLAEVYRRIPGAPVRRASLHRGGDVYLTREGQYVINPGSCGQPRDRNWQASYGVYDTVTRHFHVSRVAYDVDQASRKIVAAGLPEHLAMRLHYGR